MEIVFPVSELNCGSNNSIITIAINRDKKVMNSDSRMYCTISDFLFAPTVFFTPISLSLVDALAVDKFIKLIQAISNIMMAIIENSFTYAILPPDTTPFS